jgi:hypothetical protein
MKEREKRHQQQKENERHTEIESEISSSHGGEYEVQNCLLGCTAV